MDDFLYNLRRQTDKQNRRQSGQQAYRGPDRRNVKDPRRTFTRRNDASTEQLAELLPEIKSLLETLGENQKKLVANEKRKTLALENIAASLRLMSGNKELIGTPEEEKAADETAAAGLPDETVKADLAPEPAETEAGSDTEPESEAAEVSADAGAEEENLPRSNREDVRKIALELREQGKTYKEIAQYLDDEKIPTFSGKGGWHAPTIHKLCK